MPLTSQEGPVGLIVCPSRELARQTYDVIIMYADAIKYETVLPNPTLRVMLCIGKERPLRCSKCRHVHRPSLLI